MSSVSHPRTPLCPESLLPQHVGAGVQGLPGRVAASRPRPRDGIGTAPVQTRPWLSRGRWPWLPLSSAHRFWRASPGPLPPRAWFTAGEISLNSRGRDPAFVWLGTDTRGVFYGQAGESRVSGGSPDPNRALGTGLWMAPARQSVRSSAFPPRRGTALFSSPRLRLRRASRGLARSPAGIFGKGEGLGVGVRRPCAGPRGRPFSG